MKRHGTLSIPTRRKPTPRKRPEPVLIVLHPDGWVEAYADRHVDVKICQRLDAPDDDPRSAHLQDAILEHHLPRKHREVFLPVNPKF